jgi:alkylation response protein AidB-like acyl-CoA dehydrogenase
MIDLLPSAEQEQIAESIARFLGDNLPVERYRRAAGVVAPYEPWPRLAELGCFGLSGPEPWGGSGYTLTEEVMAFREYGRFLLTPSVLATVLAARLAAAAQMEDLCTRLMSGEIRVAIANPLRGASLTSGGAASGPFHLIDAPADGLALAWTEDAAALYPIEAFGTMATLPALDRTAALARAAPEGAQPLARRSAAGGRIDLEAAVLLAAMLVGMTEAVCALAVEHAKTRVQFGRPIGAFQGVKHKCADMALAAEAAWSQTVYAALSLQAGSTDAPFQALNAKLIASEAALESARHTIQIFGGMGFTAEVDAHLYLKRAHLLSLIGLDNRSIMTRLLDLPIAS